MARECRLCPSRKASEVARIESVHVPNNYTLYQCAKCGSRFFDPDEHDSRLAELYDTRAEKITSSQAAFHPTAYWRHEVNTIRRLLGSDPRSTLDVGCGSGELLLHWPATMDRCGVELAAHLAATAEARGLEIRQQRLETATFNGGFDVVTCYAILEHLSQPHAFLETLPTLVGGNGILAIMVPGYQTLKARLLERLGIRWHMYSPPEHLNLFSRRFLDEYLEARGFKLLQRRYTSGGLLNPMRRIPLARNLWSRAMWWIDAYSPMNRLPVFDHMYSYYKNVHGDTNNR